MLGVGRQHRIRRVRAGEEPDQARRHELRAVVDKQDIRAEVGLERAIRSVGAGDRERDGGRRRRVVGRADYPDEVLVRDVVVHGDHARRAQLAGAGDARPAAAVQAGRARGADTGRRVQRVLSRRAEGAEGGSGGALVRPSGAKGVARGADRGLVRPGRRRRAARLRGIILVKARRARRAGGGEGVGARGAGSTGGRIRPAAARAAHVVPGRAGPVRAAVVRAAGGDVGRAGHVTPQTFGAGDLGAIRWTEISSRARRALPPGGARVSRPAHAADDVRDRAGGAARTEGRVATRAVGVAGARHAGAVVGRVGAGGAAREPVAYKAS